MTMNEKMTDQERWLAAEYALGVLSASDMARAEKKMAQDRAFREAVEGWNNQLSPLLDEVEEVKPPRMVWNSIESKIARVGDVASVGAGSKSSEGFWKLMTAFMSTAAVACFGLLMFTTGGDFSGQKVKTLQAELAAAREAGTSSETALSSTLTELDSVTEELNTVRGQLDASNSQLAAVQQQINEAQPLVASLTQSGDAPAFVAQYDPLKKALLIRTTVQDTDEKVPEIWLIPEQGDRKGEVLSLGVMSEDAPDTVRITDDFLPLIGEGGTLAITMEPPGGAPNGVATGPVIALGKLQAL